MHVPEISKSLDYGLLECAAIHFGSWVTRFKTNMLPPSSRCESREIGCFCPETGGCRFLKKMASTYQFN